VRASHLLTRSSSRGQSSVLPAGPWTCSISLIQAWPTLRYRNTTDASATKWMRLLHGFSLLGVLRTLKKHVTLTCKIMTLICYSVSCKISLSCKYNGSRVIVLTWNHCYRRWLPRAAIKYCVDVLLRALSQNWSMVIIVRIIIVRSKWDLTISLHRSLPIIIGLWTISLICRLLNTFQHHTERSRTTSSNLFSKPRENTKVKKGKNVMPKTQRYKAREKMHTL